MAANKTDPAHDDAGELGEQSRRTLATIDAKRAWRNDPKRKAEAAKRSARNLAEVKRTALKRQAEEDRRGAAAKRRALQVPKGKYQMDPVTLDFMEGGEKFTLADFRNAHYARPTMFRRIQSLLER